MAKTLIQLKKINKSFGGNHVVKDLSIDIMDGEFLTLLGPSGCGKTTILRMISGFEMPDDGEITLLGENLLQIPANKREVNTVFQNYALFPHLTVKENIGFGMRMKKVSADEIETRVNDILKLTKLESFAFRKPGQLSGGQQQRVAVARSLVNRPKLVLLDEPLGALDLQLRKQMQIELKRLQRKLGMTYVYVTHDQEEAMTMSDRIIVMNGGEIEQIGTPEEVYNTPKTTFVAKFLGESNIFEGRLDKNGDGCFFSTEGIEIPVSQQDTDTGLAAVRPEFFTLHSERPDALCLEGNVCESAYLGNINRIGVALPSGKIIYVLEANDDFSEGMKVFVTFDISRLSFIKTSK